jgi:hypothetical protein
VVLALIDKAPIAIKNVAICSIGPRSISRAGSSAKPTPYTDRIQSLPSLLAALSFLRRFLMWLSMARSFTSGVSS